MLLCQGDNTPHSTLGRPFAFGGMMTGFIIDVRSNLKERIAQLTTLERQFLPIATAKALTFSAEAAKDGLYESMTRVFDRPTRFTLNSLRLKTANTRDQTAAVYLRDFAGKGTPAPDYLLP